MYQGNDRSCIQGGSTKCSLRAYSHTIAKSTLFLAIVVSILGGIFNIKPPGRESLVGNSSSLSPSQPCVTLSCSDSSVISSLRTFSADIIDDFDGLCSCINKGRVLNNNKWTERCIGIIRHTIRREERGCVMSSSTGGQECGRNFRPRTRRFQPPLLRALIAAIAGFQLESSPNGHKKKPLISQDGVKFRDMFRSDRSSPRLVIVTSSCYATREPRMFLGNVFGGKPFVRYILFLTILYVICLSYSNSHTLNLDARYEFHSVYAIKFTHMKSFW